MTVIVRTMHFRAGVSGVLAIVFLLVVLGGCVSITGPATGTLSLSTSPSGADVYLDGQFRGSTPCTVADVATGQHTLEFRLAGHESFSQTITVPAGPSQYSAALLPLAVSSSPVSSPDPAATPAASLTLRVGKETMIVGESNTFSGTAAGTNTVRLTLVGPGKYTTGVSLVQQNVDAAGEWGMTWTPGTALVPGTYTIVAEDAWKTIAERKNFKVIGGGIVSISPSSYAAARGQTLTFSGQCTTGAPNVKLALFGPGQFSSGVVFPEVAVDSGGLWSFRYKLDTTMPTGQYTMYVYDSPKTTSGSTQFTVGYAT